MSQLIKVHSYESMGTFDGPGLRYVVFLQGCPFRCKYCANPDTIDAVGESRPTSPDYILEQAVSMKPFFGRRGGITFSGGEPTVQAEALIPLFRRLKDAGIHICVDTNGGIWNRHVEELLRLTDLVLLDVKEFNDERHRHITGRSNEQTLRTARWLEAENRPFWLRYVLVPGLSDAEEDLRALGEHFGACRQIRRVELLPYHTLGVHKYVLLSVGSYLSFRFIADGQTSTFRRNVRSSARPQYLQEFVFPYILSWKERLITSSWCSRLSLVKFTA